MATNLRNVRIALDYATKTNIPGIFLNHNRAELQNGRSVLGSVCGRKSVL